MSGTTERIAHSVAVMFAALALPQPAQIPHHNPSHRPEVTLTGAMKARLERLTYLDDEVCAWARERLERDWAALQRPPIG